MRENISFRQPDSVERLAAPPRYDAFISYSWAADGLLSPALQDGLQKLAKQWYRPPAIRIFRDKTSLAAAPGLWSEVERNLAQCRYFILMASEASAQSHWVGKEVEWWRAHRSSRVLMVVLTDGVAVWDAVAGDFDYARSTCLTPALKGFFTEEPLFVDLRWARNQNDLSLRHARFRAAILDLAAPLHGQPKDALDSEDIRQNRRQRLAMRSAGAVIVGLAISAALAAWQAVQNERRAVQEARIAEARGLAAQAQLSVREGRLSDGATLALRSHATKDTPEGRAALFQIVQASWDYRGVLRPLNPGAVVAMAFQQVPSPLPASEQPPAALMTFSVEHGVQRWDTVARRAIGPAWRPDIRMAGLPSTKALDPIVIEAAFSSDGYRLAIGTNDGRLQFWDTASQSLQWEGRAGLTDVKANVTKLAFDPSGAWLVSGDSNGYVTLWELARQRQRPLKLQQQEELAHEFAVTGLALSKGAKFLAVANGNPSASVGVWMLPAGKLASSVSPSSSTWVNRSVGLGESDGVTEPVKIQLLVGTSYGGVSTWIGDAAGKLRQAQSAQPHQGNVQVVGVRGQQFATGSADGLIALMGNGQSAPVTPASWTRAPVRSLAFSDDGSLLAAGTEDGHVLLLDATTARPLYLDALGLSNDASGASVANSSPLPGGRLLSTREGLTLRTWLPGPPRKQVASIALRPLKDDDDERRLLWSSDGRWLLADAGDRSFDLWRTDGPTPRDGTLPNGPLGAAHFSHDGRWLVYEADHRGHVWNLSAGRPIYSGPAPTRNSWMFDAASTRLVISTGSGAIRLLDLTRETETEITLPASANRPLALSSNGRWLVTVGDTSDAQLVDLKATLPGFAVPGFLVGSTSNEVVFSHDGRFLVLTRRGEVMLWDLAAERVVAHFVGHGSSISSAAFSPDDSLLATVDSDGSLIVWEVGTGRRLSEPLIGRGNYEDANQSVRFSPDGYWLYVEAGRIPMHPTTWIAEICSRLLTEQSPGCKAPGR